MKKIYSMINIQVLFSLLLMFDAIFSQSVQQKIPNLVHHVIKKPLFHAHDIEHMSVESDIYLQRIITSHNAHMKHAILEWLKKDTQSSYAKELFYLLSQLDSTTTVRQSILLLTRAVSAYQSMRHDIADYQESSAWQERAYAMMLLQCSVVLVSVARRQLLSILDEIHTSLLYWREQKRSPMSYFLHKSPLKWVTGKRQADEIATNIKKLEKLEYDVRIVLGRLIKHIYEFDLVGTIDTSYTWINSLLSILKCIGKSEKKETYDSRFEETAAKMMFKLHKVSYLKDNILSLVSSARKPGHIARNWLLYAVAALGAYQARNFYITKSDFVHESLSRASEKVVETWDLAIDPFQRAWKTIFASSAALTPEGENLLMKRAEEIQKVLPELEAKKTELVELMGKGPDMKEEAMNQLKDLLGTGRSTYSFFGWGDKEREEILSKAEAGNLDPLKNAISATSYLNPALKSELAGILAKLSAADYVRLVSGIGVDVAKIIPPIAGATEMTIGILGEFVKSNALNMKLLTLIPAFGIALGANKVYHWMMQRDLSSVRLALLDVNSLFIESDAPLSDHDYGKLMYLLQVLKIEASRYLTVADMRDDFLHDLAKLESNKFDVKKKRGIIKNMFMKYPFLALTVKST